MSIHDGSKRAWLVTGCSTGLGREHASLSLPRGHRVVATALDVLRLGDLVVDCPATSSPLRWTSPI
jgi:NAD(P)-dependent dehydrogenase (short-subunit alcohol dehydrogenase family)